MASLQRNREHALLRFDRAGFAREALDATVAYLGVEHAPPGASRTRRGNDGSIVLETTLRGRVTDVDATGFVLERAGVRARVRHLLPSALDLGPLAGADVSLELSERLHGMRCVVDARLRDAVGRLVLWTHDGALPGDRAAHGLAMRMRTEAGRHELAVAHSGGLTIVRGPSLARVESEQGPLTLLVLRTGPDDAAFAAFPD